MALQGRSHAGMKDLQLEEKPSLVPCLLKSTRSPWVSPEWDRCNKARRPLGGVKEKHRAGRSRGVLTLLEVSIIHWRCWHLSAHICIHMPKHARRPPPTHTHIHTHIHLSVLFSWQEVSHECGTQKTLERKQGRSHSYRWLSRAERDPRASALHRITQIEKPSPDKCALSRAEGRFYVSLSLSDGDVEGRLWRSACSRLLQSLVQWWGLSTRQYPHYPSLYFSASTDVHQALCLDTQHALSACYGPTQVTV